MSIATRLRSKKTSGPRILVLVGNDLRGDSRVQKIIKSSLDVGNDTYVLARKAPQNEIPEGLEKANFLRVSFDASSPQLNFGNEPIERARRTIQIVESKISRFLRSIWIQIVYCKRRTPYHLKRKIGSLLYSSRIPKQLHRHRSKLLAPRRAGIEVKRANAFFESNDSQVAIIYPDFADYLERMFSWFIKPAIKTKPNLIHANDADTLRIAIAVKDYWKEREHRVAIVYDAHEFTAGVYRANPTWLPAMESLEYKYVPKVDAVVTVSVAIANLIKERFSLEQLPRVVINAPSFQNEDITLPFPTLRKSLNLDASVPLFVYVGVSSEIRGIHTTVEALKYYPEAHLAIVTKNNHYLATCRELAKDIGVMSRVHIKPYVAQHLVSAYISDASAGISPILHHPNHELSCFTKFYEFLQSRLPIITSDVQVMKETTLSLGVGTSFKAGDPIDCADQMKELISNLGQYQSAITDELLSELSWESQVSKLHALYQEAYDLVTTDSQ